MPQITITDLTEAEVEAASAMLDAKGFAYDEDYTTLYGARWAIVGMQFANAAAAALVVARYATAQVTRTQEGV